MAFKEKIKETFTAPSREMRLAYGRFFHILASASVIGLPGVALSRFEGEDKVEMVIALLFCFVISFLLGNSYFQGVKK